jgi:hypothetical protein
VAIPVYLVLRPRPEETASIVADVAPVLSPLAYEPVELDDAIVALRRYWLVSLAETVR